MASISQAESETAPETFSELLSVLAKSASLQSLNVPFREKSASKPDTFDKVFVDIKHLEEEIEALKWLARRKEMEWDCTRQMIHQKKADIKVVKRKINMVKTVNDLGERFMGHRRRNADAAVRTHDLLVAFEIIVAPWPVFPAVAACS